ncbi:MAG TPA: DNA polymerase ligase N-terminal domain-containing protein [Candidatus Saccharicenans sp.]|nr:DNA polymerase ligase N-terminal domain-containing protein [Candidatus Saccharicenans sp.]HOJ26540.1 DNA polymerase ligase N-terminal domain-containing protein [Candidatus Saccharicenans sp.]HOL45901.1 DNA polymerase ligase N-terminal domain-containing protein [Candidatus Saccharicenans sp.]HOM94853.1 DNA polymerase ligase N-terminal domain-containing protein [Candidatus Saccharicenans sp.]HOT69158.1 DNA polymerase ligase N-terminal domain-containing protein [Candidatus Saccharicenans sp.]
MVSGRAKTDNNQQLIYVIQKHEASHLHYDLRLELDGILKSWALPKPPPLRAGEKRLAIEVEDHPLGYEKFEGIIPAGQYGAGRVEIWDKGYYQPVVRTDDKLEILISGEKLKGIYSLIRFQGKNQEDKKLWLFFKNKDQKKVC